MGSTRGVIGCPRLRDRGRRRRWRGPARHPRRPRHLRHAPAQCVHGIADRDIIGAATWDAVLPWLMEVTAGRPVLAYNADYDLGVVLADTSRRGLDAAHLWERRRWSCLMRARS